MKKTLDTKLELKRLEDLDDYRRNAPDVLGTKGAAKFLGVPERTLVESIEELDIPCRSMGRTLIFSREALVDWVKGEKKKSAPCGFARNS